MKTLSKPRHLKKCENHLMRDATVCLNHGILPLHWAPGVRDDLGLSNPKLSNPKLSNCCFSLAHQSLARQTGVQLPPAGIWVCAFNISNYLPSVWRNSLKKDPPDQPCDSRPRIYLERILSFLKWWRWDADGCSPGNNLLHGTNSRKMLSSYPKKPNVQLSK